MSIKKNFSFNFIYQLLGIAVSLITTPYIARVLGAELSGIYSFYHSVANYFYLFAMLGINNYGNRSIAYVRDNYNKLSSTFCEIYIIQLIMSLCMLVFYFFYVFLLSNNLEISLILSIYVFASVFDINWFFWGIEKFSVTVVRNIIIKIVLMCAVFLFVKEKQDIYVYTGLMAVSNFASNIVLVPFLCNYIHFAIPNRKSLIQHLKPILILFLPVMAISLYNIMDKIMLGKIGTKEAVGYYDYAEKIMQIPNAFITAAGAVMLPRMSNVAKTKDFSVAEKYIDRTMNVISFFSIGMAFGIAGIADNLIPLFLGKSYYPCINLIIVLSPVIIIKAWANVIRTQYLIPYGKDKVYVFSVSAGALVNIILNLLLIPKYNAMGAVIGTLFAEITVMGYQIFKVRYDLNIKKYFICNYKYVFVGALMLFMIKVSNVFLSESGLILVIDCCVGGLIYILGAVFVDGSKNNCELLRFFLKNK